MKESPAPFRSDPFRLSPKKMLAWVCLQILLECVLCESQCLADPLQDEKVRPESAVDGELPATPQRFIDLVERGKVAFEFYDKEKAVREFPAETQFDFRLTYRFRYMYDVRNINGTRTAMIEPDLEDLEIVCSSKIILPSVMRGDNFWNHELVGHEFEHVRLNCDARPRLLAKYLLKQINRLEQPLGNDAAADKEKIKDAIATSIQKIRLEVVRIIQANNDYLDELTRHGVAKLEDSDAFFTELYTVENLAKHKFAYLDDVRNLLKLPDYRESK